MIWRADSILTPAITAATAIPAVAPLERPSLDPLTSEPFVAEVVEFPEVVELLPLVPWLGVPWLGVTQIGCVAFDTSSTLMSFRSWSEASNPNK